ncbi:MAG: hypothetical protein AAFZ18_26735 [Myxococcota bacterium]
MGPPRAQPLEADPSQLSLVLCGRLKGFEAGLFAGQDLSARTRCSGKELHGWTQRQLQGRPLRQVLALVRPRRSERIFRLGERLGVPVRVLGPTAVRRACGLSGLIDGMPAHRLAAMVASLRRYGACAVVHADRSIAIDLLSAEGAYLGGVVAPTFQESALERVEPMSKALVRNVGAGQRAGAWFGLSALIDGLLDRLLFEAGRTAHRTVVATGALSADVRNACRWVEVAEPELVLEGALEIHQLVSGDEPRGARVRAPSIPQGRVGYPPILLDAAKPSPRPVPSPPPVKPPRYARREVPTRLRLVAGEGNVPMGPRELVETQFALLADKDPSVIRAAEASLGELPLTSFVPAVLSDTSLPPVLLGYLTLRSLHEPLILQALVLNPRTPNEVFPVVAEVAPEPVAEIIASNHKRLLELPGIVLGLERNPEVSRAMLDSAAEFLVRQGIVLPSKLFRDMVARLGFDAV